MTSAVDTLCQPSIEEGSNCISSAKEVKNLRLLSRFIQYVFGLRVFNAGKHFLSVLVNGHTVAGTSG